MSNPNKKFNKDSIKNTVIVTFSLCIVASLIVSFIAISLKSLEEQNKLLEKRRNILEAAGIIEIGQRVTFEEVEKEFQNIKEKIVDFKTGNVVEDVPENYDPLKASKDLALSVSLTKKEDIAGLKRRENQGPIYEVLEGDEVATIILPIRGYGLWSTLYGFLALDGSGKKIKGITYYEHAETPGLGGEVDNPKWKKSWVGKTAYNDNGEVAIRVLKGGTAKLDSNVQIDGLAGATITTYGIDYMIQFWLGQDKGYGKYLAKNIFN